MSSQKTSYDNSENALDNDMDMDMDKKGWLEHAPVSAGTRSRTVRVEEGRAPPGPTSSKEKYRARSRSGSVSSVSSRASSASITLAAERKSRRELAQEANRLAIAVARERGKETPVIVIASESEGTVEEEMGSPAREDPSRKRKLVREEGITDTQDETQRKQGRPRDTGHYVGRAKAIEEQNKKMREAAALDNERILKNMSSGQIFSKMEHDLEEAMDELSDAPTADVAHQARECMAQVIKVAKGSRNLQGGYVKILKHAAVVGSASAEILRTRADCLSGTGDTEVSTQIMELRNELKRVRREAQQAREEAEKAKSEADMLRKELAEVKRTRRTKGQRRTYVRDSSSSPSPDDTEKTKLVTAPTTRAEGSHMEVEETAGDATQPTEYNDERRKREILPPREQWPDAVRPPIRGKAKILEDRPMDGYRIRPMDGHRVRLEKKEGR